MSEGAASSSTDRRLPLWQRVALLGFAAAILAMAIGRIDYFKGLELTTLDLRFQLREVDMISSNLLFVGIGDYELKKHGQWTSWSRSLQAQMLSVFTNNAPNPRGIGYDVIFNAPFPDRDSAPPSRSSSGKERKAGPEPAKACPGYQEDAFFGKILTQLGNVSLPGMVRRESKTRQSKPQLDPSSLAWLQGQVIPSGDRFQPESEIDLVAPAFRKDTHFAVLNAPRDKDCIIRRVPMLVRQGDHWIPSLSLRLLMLYHTIQPNEITVDPGRTVRLTSPNVDLRIPVVENPNNGDQELLINYRGVLKNFAALPFQAMMEAAGSSRRDPDLEKILQHAHEGLVIIGVTATGWDVGPTPLHPNSPLVTVHVNAVNNLLQEDFLRTTPEVMVFVLTLLLSSFVAWSTQKLSAGRGAMAFSGTLLLFLVIIWRLFVGSSLWVPFVIPSAGLILAYTGGTALRFTGEERQKRELRRAFGNYLSANIMEEVLKNPAAMQLGGDLKEITVLFTDVRGFTSFCEQNRADPKKVVAVLNEVLGVISEIVIKHDGTLDKYIGDCVMAFWGAPTPGKKHHAQQAVEAAFEMRHVLARCRKEWETRGLPVLYLGVGINTGTMVVGNIGSERRLRNYTVIGHEVNMGARLESQTRQFDTDIILSQATVDHLGPNFKTRYLAEVQVKGAEQPLKIYALEDIQTA